MAKENISKFFNTAMTEKTLAEKLTALAGESGFAFTAEELLELGAARPLSDGEVADAVGGNRRLSILELRRYSDPQEIV